jgi:acyl-CoA synthetase
LFGLDKNSGQLLWTVVTCDQIYSSPVVRVVEEFALLMIGTHGRKAVCYKGDVGLRSRPSLHWETSSPSEVFAVPMTTTLSCGRAGDEFALTNDSDLLTLFCATEGKVMMVSLEEGSIIGELSVGGEIFSSPAVWNDLIVIGCRNNQLYVVKAQSV